MGVFRRSKRAKKRAKRTANLIAALGPRGGRAATAAKAPRATTVPRARQSQIVPAPRAQASGTRGRVSAPRRTRATPSRPRSRPSASVSKSPSGGGLRPSRPSAPSTGHHRGLSRRGGLVSKKQWRYAFATHKPWAHKAAHRARPYKSLPLRKGRPTTRSAR